MNYHRQPTIKGVTRRRLSSFVLPEVERKIRALADRYKVRPSWVEATILNDAFHVRGQKRYIEAGDKRRKYGRSNR